MDEDGPEVNPTRSVTFISYFRFCVGAELARAHGARTWRMPKLQRIFRSESYYVVHPRGREAHHNTSFD